MSDNKATGGIGFFGLLTIVFIVLKICKVISWKWIWVFSPLWIDALLGLIILVIWFLARRK